MKEHDHVGAGACRDICRESNNRPGATYVCMYDIHTYIHTYIYGSFLDYNLPYAPSYTWNWEHFVALGKGCATCLYSERPVELGHSRCLSGGLCSLFIYM